MFLDTSLRTSSRFFQYLFQCFAEGETVVPRLGMGAIPRQLAAVLPQVRILTESMATGVRRAASRYVVTLQDGQTLEARAVVVATDADAAQQLLGQLPLQARRTTTVAWNGTTTLYYAAERPPVVEPILMLNGEGAHGGPVNHAVVMTNVSEAYAPAGAHLICANVVGHAPKGERERAELEGQVRQQMRRWFGQQAGKWQVVGGYFLPQALPLQRYAEWNQGRTSIKRASGGRGKRDDPGEIFLCGDYCETASIQGALASGRRTAEAAAAALRS